MNTSVQIVRSFYSSLRAGDAAGIATLLSPHVVLHVPGRNQLAADYLGPAGVGAFAEASRALTGGHDRLEVVDLLGGDTHVAAVCRVTGEREGRADLDNRTIHLARVEDGRIAEIWFHNFDQHAVDAFWGTRQQS